MMPVSTSTAAAVAESRQALEDNPVIPLYKSLIPNRNWLNVNIAYPSSKTWLKIVIITGSATGAVVLGTYLYRRFYPSTKRTRNVNVNGTVHSETDTNSAPPSRVVSRKTTRDETCGGLAILLEEDQLSSKSDQRLPPSDSFELPPRRFPHRRRADSVTSGTTTLLITSRTPQELLLYGLESLKRAIRLFEESRTRLKGGDELDSVDLSELRDSSVDSELEFILSKAKQLADDVEDYRKELSPARDSIYEDKEDVCSQDGSEKSFGASTTLTLPFFDIEPNIHFFKLYTTAAEDYDNIVQPRLDRTLQVNCDSREEFVGKVHCLRQAFADILQHEENRVYFSDIGRDILDILLSHSGKDTSDCFAHYDRLIAYVLNPENHESIEKEIAIRGIPCLTFYDVAIDYMILESFDDLDSPPSAVLSVSQNRWLSSGFKELALQTAVSAVLRHKRSKLVVPDGFFAHFYNILETVSPTLAWGFLGTDYDLKFKCNLVRESLLALIRDLFSFDRVRYTSLNDLTNDILRVTDDGYNELNDKLSVCK